MINMIKNMINKMKNMINKMKNMPADDAAVFFVRLVCNNRFSFLIIIRDFGSV